MPVRASLAFRALDAHVVAGRADEPALVHPDGALSFAELLDASASLAGGLRVVGVATGHEVLLAASDVRVRVVTMLACVRHGAEIAAVGAEAHAVVTDDRIRVGDLDEAWEVVLRAGRGDPLPAPAADPDGYAERLLADHGSVLGALIDGRPAAP